MRTSLLLISIALLAACSDDSPPPPVAQAPAAVQPASTEQADVAVAEISDPEQPRDPCDLSGFDMSKMTVDLHEALVKACQTSKEQKQAESAPAEKRYTLPRS